MAESAKEFYSEYYFSLKPEALMEAKSLSLTIHPKIKFEDLEVELSDINLYSQRLIVTHSISHKGDQMVKKHSQTQNLKVFYVELNQVAYVEEDPTKNCTNYPNNKYMSYKDCDRQSALSALFKEISPKFHPLWAAAYNNLSSVTTEPYVFENIQKNSRYLTHVNYPTGLQTTSCKTNNNTIAKFITDQEQALGARISVTFNQDMQVTQTSVVQFDPIKSLCNVGRRLGLWLGLGALQLGELIDRTANQAAHKLTPTSPKDVI